MDSLESAVDKDARTLAEISKAKRIGHLRTGGGRDPNRLCYQNYLISIDTIERGGKGIFPFIVLQPFVWIRGISLLLGAQRLLFKAAFRESYL